MSQPRPKGKPQTPPPASPLPGIISAVVVLLVLGLVAGILINRAGGGSTAQPTAPAAQADNSATTDAALPTTEAAPTVAAQPAAPVAGVQPTAASYSYDAAPPLAIDPAKQYTATIATPRGEIVVELLPEIAPQTVNNFVFLARNNFYNGLSWHRVLPNFMAQGGDPSGDGTGGPGYSIPAEFTDQLSFKEPGMVAMARSQDPDSAGSQFFITTGDASWLDGQYTIFGRVVSGQEIVNGIPLRDPQNPADLSAPGETILGVAISEQ